MSDMNTDPVLSLISTVGSNLSALALEDGQLIFVPDKRRIILDLQGKRTVYSQIEEIATDSARTSILAPITGLFYFVVETNMLWTYRNGWVPVTNRLSTQDLDSTLTQAGKAADAKVVGDAIKNIDKIPSIESSDNGKFLKVSGDSLVWDAIITKIAAQPEVPEDTSVLWVDTNDDTMDEIPNGGNVDLTGYATEQYVKDYAQPKGNYLTKVPDGYAKTDDIPTKPEDIGAQPSGNYLTEVPSGYATEEFVRNRIAEAELGGNGAEEPFVVQSGAPTDTSVMWVDIDDDTVEIPKSEHGSELDAFVANTDIAHLYDETTGAYYTVIRVYKQKIDGTYQYPFVYAPNGANAGNKSTLDMTKGDGWLLAINSGVFDTSTNKPDGIVIQNGAVIKNSPTTTHSQCKPLTIDRNGNLSYAEYDADAEQLVGNGIISAVCGFIPIIVDYEAVPETEWNSVAHYTQNAQRQIIGQWGNGDYAIITCEGRGFHNSDGWTIAEAQTICRKHGLKFAYNLDGGGSTETMLGLKPVNTIYENTTGRIVPTFIVFNGTTVPPHEGGNNEPELKPYVIVRSASVIAYTHGLFATSSTSSTRMTAVSTEITPKLPFEVGEGVSNYAPIALPDGATAITVVSPGFVPAVTLWTTDGQHWTRTADPGWMTLGGGTYSLPTDAEYTHYAVNFKNVDSSNIAPDADISGISITVKTVQEPNPEPDIDFSQMGNLYRLPTETVFSGDDYIDTGVKLVETDRDFTIAFSVTPGTQSSQIPQIFNCQKETTGYPGMCFSTHNSSNYYRFCPGYGANSTNVPKSTTEPFKVVITHKKDTGYFVLKWLYDGVIGIGNRNNVVESNFVIDVNFIIGAWQNTDGSKGRYWVGTMHDFFIDDYVWNDTIIEAYLK